MLAGAAAVSLLLGAGAPALAQNAPDAADASGPSDQLEEVVVTARRMGEALDSVPLAVTAFTAESLEAQNIKNLTDISRNTPGFQFQNQSGGGSGRNDRSGNVLTFRGLALSGGGGLLFLDGAPVAGNNPPPITEIERVEVLKGPQSVYFGRSTFIGAINFVSKDPEFTFGGSVRAETGTYGSNEFGATVNIPVVQDVLAMRISAVRTHEGGQYRNYANRNDVLGDRDTDALSAQVLFMPNESLRIKAYASITELNDGPPAQAALNRTEMNCNLGGTSGAYYCGQLPRELPKNLISANYEMGPYEYAQLFDNVKGFPTAFSPHWSKDPGLRRRLIQTSLRADWEFGGGFTLGTITAYHQDKSQNILDLTFRDARNTPNANLPNFPDALPYVKWLLLSQGKTWDFSQEVRITSPQEHRLRFTAGASYFTQRTPLSGVLYGIAPFGTTFHSVGSHSRVRTPAVFGGLYFDVLPNITLSAEGRYQWDKIMSQALTTSTGVPVANAPRNSATFRSFAPRVTLDWEFRPNATAYVLFSRGFRPGGFNTALATQTPDVIAQAEALGAGTTFDEERLDNYEAGVKGRFWDNRAALRLAVYRDLYREGQISNTILFFTSAGQSNLINVTQNLGSVNLWGVELEGEVVPTRGLTLSGTFGFADSKVVNSTCAECRPIMNDLTAANGKKSPAVPRLMWTLSANYERPISDEYDFFSRVDYRHRGRMYGDAANVQWSAPEDRVDIRAGVRTDRFTVEAFVTNLFNNKTLYGTQAADAALLPIAANQIRVVLPDLRRAGVRAAFNF